MSYDPSFISVPHRGTRFRQVFFELSRLCFYPPFFGTKLSGISGSYGPHRLIVPTDMLTANKQTEEIIFPNKPKTAFFIFFIILITSLPNFSTF